MGPIWPGSKRDLASLVARLMAQGEQGGAAVSTTRVSISFR